MIIIHLYLTPLIKWKAYSTPFAKRSGPQDYIPQSENIHLGGNREYLLD